MRDTSKYSEAAKKRWNDPVQGKILREKLLEHNKSDSMRKIVREMMKKTQPWKMRVTKPTSKELSDRMKKVWKDPKHREKLKGKTGQRKGCIPWNKGMRRVAWNKGVTPSEDTRKKMSEAAKVRCADPEYKEKMKAIRSENTKKRWEDPEYRKKMGEMTRKKWEDPEYRAKMEKRNKEASKRMMGRNTKLFADPEFRERFAKKRSEISKKQWSDPEFKKKMSEIHKKRWERAKGTVQPVQVGDKVQLKPTEPRKPQKTVLRQERSERRGMKFLLSDFNRAIAERLPKANNLPVIYLIRDLVNNKVYIRGVIGTMVQDIYKHRNSVRLYEDKFVINQNHIDCQIHTRPHTEFEIELLKTYSNGVTQDRLKRDVDGFISQYNSMYPAGYNGLSFSTSDLSLKIDETSFVPFNTVDESPKVNTGRKPKKTAVVYPDFLEYPEEEPEECERFIVTPEGTVPFQHDWLMIVDSKGNIHTHYQKVA